MQRTGTYTLCIVESQMLLGSFDIRRKHVPLLRLIAWNEHEKDNGPHIANASCLGSFSCGLIHK
jgi:hypothetical protein